MTTKAFKAEALSDQDEYVIFFSDDGNTPPDFMVYVRYDSPAVVDANGNFPDVIYVEVKA